MAKAIRQGPSNRGPFKGATINALSDSLPIAPPMVEPVSWKPKQRGNIDLTVNVAILAISAAVAVPIPRAPVVVNKPTTKVVQVEQTVNIAARVPVVGQPAPVMVEPVTWKAKPQFDQAQNRAVYLQSVKNGPYDFVVPPKKASQQPGLSPNLAIVPQVSSLPLTEFIEPQLAKRPAQQPDLAPNLAIRPAVVEPTTRLAVVVNAILKPKPQPDLYPNLSLGVAPSTHVPRALIEPVTWKAKSQPDLYPNIAAQVIYDFFSINADDALTSRKWQQVDLYPNLSVAVTVATPLVREFIEPQQAKRGFLQPELAPNLAVATPAVAYVPRQTVEPQVRRNWVQPDLYPNIAAQVIYDFFSISSDDALAAKKWPQFDLAPNLAILGSNDLTITLSGQAAIASVGSLSPTMSFALSGVAAIASAGTVTPVGSTPDAGTAPKYVGFVANVGSLMTRI